MSESSLDIDLSELQRIGQVVQNMKADRFVFTRPDTGNFAKVYKVNELPEEYEVDGVMVIQMAGDEAADSMYILLPQEDGNIMALKYLCSDGKDRTPIGRAEIKTYTKVLVFGGEMPEVGFRELETNESAIEIPVAVYVDDEGRLT